MIQRAKSWALPIGIVFLASIVGTAVGAAASDLSNPTLSVPDGTEYDVSELYASADSKDVLPRMVDPAELGVSGLDTESVRLLEDGLAAQTFVALDKTGLLCIVIFVPGDDWTAGSTCASPDSFHEVGLGLRVGSPTLAHEGYLIADGNLDDVELLSIGRLALVGQNVITVPADLAAKEREVLASALAGLQIPIFDDPVSYVAD